MRMAFNLPEEPPMTENNRLSTSAPDGGHAPPVNPDRPLGCRPDPGSPPSPPKPSCDWCADPKLIRSRRIGTTPLDTVGYWRGCGRCPACLRRARYRQAVRGARR